MRLAAEAFNEKPLSADWVRLASELLLLPKIRKSADPKTGLVESKCVALFLKQTPGLGKTQVGEYLSKGPADRYPFHAEVLRDYVNLFEFPASTSFVGALRIFLGHFRLPGDITLSLF